MIVTINDVEYDVPKEVGLLVEEARAWRVAGEGMTPLEFTFYKINLLDKLNKIQKNDKVYLELMQTVIDKYSIK